MFPIKSLCVALTCCALTAQNEERRVRNIVLVHGAWADEVEVAGASHAVYVSRPREVAALIEKAAMTEPTTRQ